MKKALTALVIFAVLAASAWLAWSLGRSSREPTPTAVAPQPTRTAPPNNREPDTSWTPPAPEATAAPQSAYAPPPAGAIPDEVALVFESQADYQQALEWLRSQGVEVLETLPGLNAIRIGTRNPIWERLGASPDEVGYNFPVATPPPVSDSPYLRQNNLGFGNSVLSYLGVEEPDPRWGQGVTIAVLDSGVMNDHANLDDARVLTLSRAEEVDTVGHGTAVSSLIVGQQPPVLGLAPGATILSLPVVDEDGQSDTFRVATAIVQAVDQGARIVNMSLGSYGDSKVLRRAVRYAREHGTALVAAVGNDGASRVSYPAAYDGVLAVAAVDALSQPASFSNYGPQVDIAAPGVNIPVAWTGDQYASVSGTSFSTPLVAAALAMILQQEPGLSALEAVDILLDNANEAVLPGKDEFVGDGILNIERILDRNKRGVYDAAIVGYSVNAEAADASTYEMNILVENRGTEYLNNTQLTVKWEKNEETFVLGPLNPGETGTETILLGAKQVASPDGTLITSEVSINGDDSRPSNNTHTETLRIQTSEK